MDAKNNCDVIENTACGKSFQYCRTHKVEAHECPGANMEVTNHTKTFVDMLAKRVGVSFEAQKLELKVGDRVRVTQDRPYSSKLLKGDVLTIEYIGPSYGRHCSEVKFVDTPYVVMSDVLEHA